jgi:hypothetical protein
MIGFCIDRHISETGYCSGRLAVIQIRTDERAFLLRVESIEPTDNGIAILPGIRVAGLQVVPGVPRIQEGASLELVAPDGSSVQTRVHRYTMALEESDDGTLYSRFDELQIQLILSPTLDADAVSPGTEIWIRNEMLAAV